MSLCKECKKYNKEFCIPSDYNSIVLCQTDSKGIHFMKWDNGDLEWVKEGQYHRENGPASIDECGEERWFLHGRRVHTVLQEELYVGKSFEYSEDRFGGDETMAIVFEEINELFYRVVIGDKKELIVSLYKYKESNEV